MCSYQRKTESYFHSDLHLNLWLKIHDTCIWLWEVRTASGCYCLLSQLSRNYLDLLFILGVNMEMNIFQVKLLDIFLMVCSHFSFHKEFTKYVPTLRTKDSIVWPVLNIWNLSTQSIFFFYQAAIFQISRMIIY